MMSGKNTTAPASAAHGTGSSSSSAQTAASASTSSSAAPRRGKLLRRSNSDRLRMHAPSSIQVDAPAAAAASEWKVAIPLLSPLDYLDFTSPWLPLADDTRASGPQPEEQHAAPAAVETRAPAGDRVILRPTKPWQHPAAPFYHDPVPATNTALFLLPQPQGA